jgi:glycosyltransferase involved in cell wall biosynthesis
VPETLLIALPTAGHGGCEYNALSFGAYAAREIGFDVVACFPADPATAFLSTLTAGAGLREHRLPLSFEADDDAGRVEAQRVWSLAAVEEIRPSVVFLAMPWPARGTGLILGFAQAGVPTLVKFALVPEELHGPPAEVLPALRSALARQVWFANSRHSAALLTRHLALPEGSLESFHVGPVGLSSLLPERGGPASERSALRASFGAADRLLVTTVARLAEQKGYRHYLDAIAALASRGDIPLRFLWVGEGELRRELEEAIAARRLDDSILMAGFRSDVRAILRASDMFVLPTLYEGGCSQALLEALEEGVPAIVSSFPGVREVVEDGSEALLVEPGSASALADGVSRLAGDGSLRRRLAAAGRERAKQLTAEVMYAETFRLLDRLLGTDYHRHPSLPCLPPKGEKPASRAGDAPAAQARSAATLRSLLGRLTRSLGFPRASR